MVKTDRIKLRRLKVYDLFDVYRNIRDARITLWTVPVLKKFSDNKVVPYLCTLIRHSLKGLALVYRSLLPLNCLQVIQLAILFEETNSVVGLVTFKRNSRHGRKAVVSFWIGVPYWGKGIMTEALLLAVDFAFDKLRIDVITAWTYEANVASSKVMEKCGFAFAGKDKNVYYKFGQLHDCLNYTLSKNDWHKYTASQLKGENNKLTI